MDTLVYTANNMKNVEPVRHDIVTMKYNFFFFSGTLILMMALHLTRVVFNPLYTANNRSKVVSTHPDLAHPRQSPVRRSPIMKEIPLGCLLVKVARGVFQFGVLKQPPLNQGDGWSLLSWPTPQRQVENTLAILSRPRRAPSASNLQIPNNVFFSRFRTRWKKKQTNLGP